MMLFTPQLRSGTFCSASPPAVIRQITYCKKQTVMVHFHCKVSFDLSEFRISWFLAGTPFGYAIVVLCHEVPAALVLQDWPLHMLL